MATEAEDVKVQEENEQVRAIKGDYKLGWHDAVSYDVKPEKGVSHAVIDMMSDRKNEPDWMRKFRHKSLDIFERKPMPKWGADLSGIDFEDIYYYIKPMSQVKSWDDMPEDIKATWDKLGIPEAEKNYLGGVTAQYECLRGSTQVWTTSGMRAIKELQPGDEVFSLDESTRQIVPAAVVGAKQSGEKEVFEIRARGAVIGASDNHPFLVLRDERKDGRLRARYHARWVPVADLRIGDLVAIATDIPEFGESAQLLVPDRAEARNFPQVTTDDLCWWAGLYIGDGYIKHNGSYLSIEIAIDQHDTELISEIQRVTQELFAIELKVASDGLRLRGRGTAALAEFIQLNGLGGKALTKRIPEWMFGLPRSQRLAFLAGYLDADGYVRNHPLNKDIALSSANPSLLEDTKELAALCGIHTSDGTAKGTDLRAHTSDMVGYVRIESIDSKGVEPVYDIEVAGHHNFVAEGFIVHNSEVVYHKTQEELERRGILFMDMDTALREHPDIVKQYFGTVIPPADNKFSALNSAVWSGGSFIYVPPGIEVEIPLQAYFRINQENMGQFERTLIIVDENSYVHYVEGCSAPVYTSDSLHSAVVEIIVKDHGRARYTTIQNWSNNVYNLVTKRATAGKGAIMEWVDGNLGCLAQGSRVTTRGGTKPIELVASGDEVLSFDEGKGALSWRRVVGQRFSGYQKVREVHLGSRRLLVTDNHPFLSYSYDAEAAKKSGRYALAYVRADQLAEAIVPVTSIDYGTPYKLEMPQLITTFRGSNQYSDQFESVRGRPSRMSPYEETTDDLMWLFGMFVGDGSIERAQAGNGGTRWAKVVFSVPGDDRARGRLVDVMGHVLPGVNPTERRDGVTVTYNSVELADFFEINGFVTGARSKRLPEWVMDLPESQRLSFIAGYLDSDGCAPAGRRGLSIKSVNRDLLEDVADVLTSLGIRARLSTEFDGERATTIGGRATTARGAHRLEFPCDSRLVRLVSERLREAALAQPEAKLRHFRRVGRSSMELPETLEIHNVDVGDHVGTVPTYDIEVEGTGNFVAEGFIVHNSKVTMKYPSIYLLGDHARGEVLSIAYAGEGQHQDAGGKVIHVAPDTSSAITSKSISKDGGRAGYRGLVRIDEGASHAKSHVICDALILDDKSRSDTYPYIEIEEENSSVSHEATVSKVSEDQLFYLMSRGLGETEAMQMIVRGFIEPITKELPMEYAVELQRLVELQMEGSVG